jgi:glycosyltransferase involved in cell wall biosynthesis
MYDLSVVIASINGLPYLRECLAALRKQQGAINAEVLVADCVGREVTEFIRREHPWVKLIPFDGRQSVPKLRSAAVIRSTGTIVAITEDHCIPPPDWYESILKAHAKNPGLAIGGSVDNGATNSLLDWAVFFCEYSNFISPVTNGIVHDLPGPNVSYKREAISRVRKRIEEEFWETWVNSEIESSGEKLWSDPSIKMIHKKHFTLGGFLWERFNYSRSYAGMRNQSLSVPMRMLYCVGSAAVLPPLLLWRIGNRVISKKNHLLQFALSVPLLFAFFIVWAFGESFGYVFGAGDSALYLS